MPVDPRNLTREQYERRRRRTRITLVAVIAVAVVVIAAAIIGPSIYRMHEDAAAKPVPTVAATLRPSTLTQQQIDGSWRISAGSSAGYRVHEVLNGQRVTVTGRTSKVGGRATVQGEDVTAADISVRVADIRTNSAARDSYFRDSALDVQAFPTATFRLTEPLLNAATRDGRTTTTKATGTLTLHGVTRTVTATIESALTGGGARLSGTIPIRFADYGVAAPSLGFVTVQDHGSVEFQLSARPAG